MLILILMPLFALGGTTYGMGEETMAFYPLLVPVMMSVGFDSLTGVAIILLGSQIGCLASTLNPFATVIASDTAGISSASGLLLRLIFWIVMTALSTYYVYRYADKIQKDPTKSLTYATREEDLKHFNVDSGEEIPSQMNKKQNVSCSSSFQHSLSWLLDLSHSKIWVLHSLTALTSLSIKFLTLVN